jgi:copper(I)-binding protein
MVTAMKRSIGYALPALFWLASNLTHAEDIEVTGAWARATLPAQKVAGVFMDIRSESGAKLVGVESPAAGAAEVHEMRNEDMVMRMRKVNALDLPAGKVVKLAPGGYHVMLFELRQPLAPGDKVKLTLKVDRGGKREDVEVVAVVKPSGSSSGAAGGGHSDH